MLFSSGILRPITHLVRLAAVPAPRASWGSRRGYQWCRAVQEPAQSPKLVRGGLGREGLHGVAGLAGPWTAAPCLFNCLHR